MGLPAVSPVADLFFLIVSCFCPLHLLAEILLACVGAPDSLSDPAVVSECFFRTTAKGSTHTSGRGEVGERQGLGIPAGLTSPLLTAVWGAGVIPALVSCLDHRIGVLFVSPSPAWVTGDS